MSAEELQAALEVAEKRHVVLENTIQRNLKNSRLFLQKALEIRKVAKERGINLTSLHEKFQGDYQLIANTYRMLEA